MSPSQVERFVRAFGFDPCFKCWAGCRGFCLCTKPIDHGGPCACGYCWNGQPEDKRPDHEAFTANPAGDSKDGAPDASK